MKRGDIYLVTLDPTEGREQQGHRLVLVVSPQAFNEATKLPVILPITNGGEFARHIVDTLPPEILVEVLAKLAPIFE